MYLYMLQKQLHHRLDQWLRTEGMLQALLLVHQGNQQEHILVKLLLMRVLALQLLLVQSMKRKVVIRVIEQLTRLVQLYILLIRPTPYIFVDPLFFYSWPLCPLPLYIRLTSIAHDYWAYPLGHNYHYL